MSDYLSNILAKSFGLVETLQPRKASRFETGWGLSDEPDLSLAESVSPSTTTRQLTPAPLPVEPGQPIAQVQAANNSTQPRPNVSEGQAMEGGPLIGKGSAVEGMAMPPAKVIAPLDRQPAPVNQTRQTHMQTERLLREVHHETTLVSPAASTPVHQPTALAQTGKITKQQTLAQPPELTKLRQNITTPQTRLVRPQITTASEMPPMTEPRPTVIVSPPTVQVNIGRIEVRATNTPSNPTNRAASPVTPAVMSLDEYLKQRSKGGPR